MKIIKKSIDKNAKPFTKYGKIPMLEYPIISLCGLIYMRITHSENVKIILNLFKRLFKNCKFSKNEFVLNNLVTI